MKTYSEQITLQTKSPREFVNITSQVKAAMEKSGFRDGMIVVTSLHSNSAVIVNDDEPGLLEDISKLAGSDCARPRRLQAQGSL